MKTAFAIAFSAGLLAATPGLAADLRGSITPFEPAEPAYPPQFNWTGFYVGAAAGHQWGRDKTTEYYTDTGEWTGLSWSYDNNGYFGGVFAGYNYQIGSFVVGAEADAEYANTSGGFHDDLTGAGAGRAKVKGMGSLRARAGFVVFDNALLYVTGGLALVRTDYTYSRLINDPVDENFSKNRLGWTVGGGVEYNITSNLFVRGEYRYTHLRSFRKDSRIAFGPDSGFGAAGLTGEQKPSSNTVRVAVGYRF